MRVCIWTAIRSGGRKMFFKCAVTKIFSSACMLFVAVAASAASTVTEVPDKAFVHGHDKAAELVFDNPDRHYEFSGISGSSLSHCELTTLDGLFCLDAKRIRNWPIPVVNIGTEEEPVADSSDLVDCEDPVLGLDSKKANTCTTFTIDQDGNVWLAGKYNGKSNGLIQLLDYDSGCPAPVFGSPVELGQLENWPAYCGYQVATGRPLLVAITSVDGAMAENFALPGYPAPQTAILALEEHQSVVAFLSTGEVVEVAAGKADWALVGNEKIQDMTVLQLGEPAQSFILVTTTHGRVLAWDAAGTGPATEFFNIVESRSEATKSAVQCPESMPGFGVRASASTGYVYVTDGEYCEVTILEPGVAEGSISAAAGTESGLNATTLSTAGLTGPDGVSVAPGNVVDLGNCSDPANPCPLASTDDGSAIATLWGVQLAEGSASGMLLFRVEGIPDCRYDPFACLAILDPDGTPPASFEDAVAALINDGVIVPLQLAAADPRDASSVSAAQRLNVTPLLPDELVEEIPFALPDMLIARYVRGQAINNFVFGGFFGILEDGVVFRGMFEGEFDIEELAGVELGCADNLGSLDWDVFVTISDRFESATNDYAANEPLHLSAIENVGCGSSRAGGRFWSFKPYNLEPTPCTFNPDLAGIWNDDGCEAASSESQALADDAVYAKMLLELADEYLATVNQFVCLDGDGNGAAPLNLGDCQNVHGHVINMQDKLHKCWEAAKLPKQSSSDQNCQAFDSQLANLQAYVVLLTPNGPDIANRVGELEARAAAMRHVFEARFMPSLLALPEQQFVEPE